MQQLRIYYQILPQLSSEFPVTQMKIIQINKTPTSHKLWENKTNWNSQSPRTKAIQRMSGRKWMYLFSVKRSTGDNVLKELTPNASNTHQNQRDILFHCSFVWILLAKLSNSAAVRGFWGLIVLWVFGYSNGSPIPSKFCFFNIFNELFGYVSFLNKISIWLLLNEF